MRRHIVLLSILVVIVTTTTVYGQTYPPELAGQQLSLDEQDAVLEVVEVTGCPFSHPSATGYYWYVHGMITPTFAGMQFMGFFSPYGLLVGPPPNEPSMVLAWNEDAGCYLHVDVNNRFVALTYDGVSITFRSGVFQPQGACCPWYEFHPNQCLWVMDVHPPDPVYRLDEGEDYVD